MPATVRERAQSLDAVFDSLQKLLSRHAPPFKVKTGTVRDKRDFQLVVPQPVAIPGAYGGRPTDLAMAGIIHQKGYVGFYYVPIYLDASVAKELSPALMTLRKGKCCFYVKKLDAGVFKDIDGALRAGTKLFKNRGWL